MGAGAKQAGALHPDQAAIAAFLSGSVGESIHLSAITPDGPITTRNFGGDAAAAAAWAAAENLKRRGLYWTVNRTRSGFSGKPEKRDIAEARFAHVDIDPPKDGSQFDKATVAARLSSLRSEPSFVIDTGGGLAAFWRLDGPAANLPAIEDINAGIADAFQGDRCHNIDRLMRLPGTVNWPNRKKIAAGRQPAPARLVADDQGLVHEPASLAAEFPKVARGPVRAVVQSAEAYPLLTGDDLGLAIFHPLRSLIERPAGRDRSTDALACAGGMVRAGHTDEQILGVLMNPANAVHEHIGGQRDPRYQALRCIEAARASKGPAMTRTMRFDDFGADAEMIAEATKVAELPIINPASWAGRDAPPREWALKDWIPLRQATLLTGKGGVGKSLLAQMLATCAALGLPFLGLETRRAPSLYVSCEDDGDELWRRQAAICNCLGVSLQSLDGQLFLAALSGEAGNAIATFDATGRLSPTDRWRAIEATVEANRIGFAALDNASHLMGGDHSDLNQVAAFLNLLNGLAIKAEGAVMLLHHPNKAGDDWLGSVAWENQVRSRLILKPSDLEGDTDVRSLHNPKANYSAMGGRVDFRWHQGAFVRDQDLPQNMNDEIAAIARRRMITKRSSPASASG